MIWLWFQSTADKIKKMDFDQATKNRLQELSDALPDAVRNLVVEKVLWLCTSAMKKFGKDFVVKTINAILEYLKTSLEGFQKK